MCNINCPTKYIIVYEALTSFDILITSLIVLNIELIHTHTLKLINKLYDLK